MIKRLRSIRSVSHWIIVVFLLIVQQYAFMSVPMIIEESDKTSLVSESPHSRMALDIYKEMQADELADPANMLNTVFLILSILLLGILFLYNTKKIEYLIRNNVACFLYVFIVIVSVTWSHYPDLCIKRAIGYLITIAVAMSLITAFSVTDCIRALSISVILSAIASIIFVFLFPQYGIMWADTLEGDWRGVFSHKNGFGQSMSVGVFAELYLITARVGRLRYRLFWSITMLCLIIMSRSSTSLMLSLFYVSMISPYAIWLRFEVLGYALFSLLFLGSIILCATFIIDTGPILELIGKDTTLSGRTYAWETAFELIKQNPILGLGYRSAYIPSDPTTLAFNEKIGMQISTSHNNYLEIMVELGLIGFSVLAVFILNSFWRALRCLTLGIHPLGYISLVFFAGCLIEGWSEASAIGHNQSFMWVTFNILAFACGSALHRLQGAQDFGPGAAATGTRAIRHAARRRRLDWDSDNDAARLPSQHHDRGR